MNTTTVTVQVEILTPPDEYYLLPQEWKGKVKFQYDDIAYDYYTGWIAPNAGVVWKDYVAVARLRPFNPDGLSDDEFRKLPMNARALSDAELERFRKMGGLVKRDEKLLCWLPIEGEWGTDRGRYTKTYTYATLHPANYYMELPDSAFEKFPGWNPENLPQEALALVPEGERLLSKSEHDRLVNRGGVIDTSKHTLHFYTDNGWFVRDNGSHPDWTFCTPHPEGYFDTLPASAFNDYRFNRITPNAIVKPRPKFKVGDKVRVSYGSYKDGWTITYVDAVQGCIRYGLVAADSTKRDYIHEDYLQSAKPVFNDASFDNTYNKPKAEDYLQSAKPIFHEDSFTNVYNKPKAEEESEEQQPVENTTQYRPHTFGSCPRHGFVRMKGCREVRPFCITEKGITPFQRAFRNWESAMDTLEYSSDGHKWEKFAQKGAK